MLTRNSGRSTPPRLPLERPDLRWRDEQCACRATGYRTVGGRSEAARPGRAVPHPSGQVVVSSPRQMAEPLVCAWYPGRLRRQRTVDQFDAANWEGDRTCKTDPRYHEAVIYKLFMDSEGWHSRNYRFADCLPIIRKHPPDLGRAQADHLSGSAGRAAGMTRPIPVTPSSTRGGDARGVPATHGAGEAVQRQSFRCTGTMDDSYRRFPSIVPELLSRDPNGEKVWFGGHAAASAARSISHTLAQESGYDADRTRRLLELLPIRETIHLDAHRPYNEVGWRRGAYLSRVRSAARDDPGSRSCFSCTALISRPRIRMMRKGGSITGCGSSHWEHPYNTACTMAGAGMWRAGDVAPERGYADRRVALGLSTGEARDQP